jgi:hypothetical protein
LSAVARLFPPLICGAALALQLAPSASPSHRLLAAALGLIGCLWIASTARRGRSPALLAAFAFVCAAALIGLIESLPGGASFASLFAVGGLAWYAVRASGGRVTRVLATLASVLGGAWIVGAQGAEVDALLDWAWVGAHACAIGALGAAVLAGPADATR